jgi:hypothetical protein
VLLTEEVVEKNPDVARSIDDAGADVVRKAGVCGRLALASVSFPSDVASSRVLMIAFNRWMVVRGGLDEGCNHAQGNRG